jgi:hypothetical protein
MLVVAYFHEVQAVRHVRERYRPFLVDRNTEISTGVFITRNEIERRAARTVIALLRDVRDVSIERAGGRTIVRSTRAPSPAAPPGCWCSSTGIRLATPESRTLTA